MKYTRELDTDYIVNRLYDFSQVGVIHVKDYIPRDARKSLIKSIQSIDHLFTEAPKQEGPVRQNMSRLYLEEIELTPQDQIFSSPISGFVKEYQEAYEKIAGEAKFKKDQINSYGIHKYPQNFKGIGSHQDYASDRDLISIFCIKGYAPFDAGKNRKLDPIYQFDVNPGDLVLMRAARNKDEQKYRPFHRVGRVKKERISLILRRRVQK